MGQPARALPATVPNQTWAQRRVLRFYRTLCDSPRWDEHYQAMFEDMWQVATAGDEWRLEGLIKACNARLIDQMINDPRHNGHFLPPISGTIDPAR